MLPQIYILTTHFTGTLKTSEVTSATVWWQKVRMKLLSNVKLKRLCPIQYLSLGGSDISGLGYEKNLTSKESKNAEQLYGWLTSWISTTTVLGFSSCSSRSTWLPKTPLPSPLHARVSRRRREPPRAIVVVLMMADTMHNFAHNKCITH